MVILVAPYTGYNEEGKVDLGASKKIRFVISALSRVSKDIVLINSAHNSVVKRPMVRRSIEIDGVPVTEIILPTHTNRPIGKVLNLLDSKKVLNMLEGEIDTHGKPKLIWFYNAYSFEMVMAEIAFKRFHVPMILEFEDWHFSRDRGLNVKPWLDYFFWKRAIKLFSKVYAINSSVKARVYPYCKNVSLLPGVVPESLSKIAIESPPFPETSSSIHIGYFGGLKSEKGADLVLKLSQLLPKKYTIHVTGSGPLSNQFIERAQSSSGQLVYHGMVPDAELLKVISTCDIILNPHVPISEFKDGLFPFKVIEAIASGRLLITTQLSFDGFEELSRGVVFAEHSVEDFEKKILGACQWFNKKKNSIVDSTFAATDLFGEQSIVSSMKLLIGSDSSFHNNPIE